MMSDSVETTPVEELSYEAARAELVEIVRALEAGQSPLEQSMAAWERGEALAAHCQRILDSAATRLRAAEAGGEDAGEN